MIMAFALNAMLPESQCLCVTAPPNMRLHDTMNHDAIVSCSMLPGGTACGHRQVAGQVQNKPDRWFTQDKLVHCLVSAYMTVFFSGYALWYGSAAENESLKIGMLVSLSLGIGKELNDRYGRKHSLSWKDLAADILGIGLGMLFMRWYLTE